MESTWGIGSNRALGRVGTMETLIRGSVLAVFPSLMLPGIFHSVCLLSLLIKPHSALADFTDPTLTFCMGLRSHQGDIPLFSQGPIR